MALTSSRGATTTTMATMARRLAARHPSRSSMTTTAGPDEPAPPEDVEADVLWKHLSAADVQAKLDVMLLTEAVVFVSALLDASTRRAQR